MFKICYAKGVVKDLKKISPDQLMSIKEGIEDLETFPNISQIKPAEESSCCGIQAAYRQLPGPV
ncbi:MAG: hypothetical protein Q3M24_00010 [Candidatus Electrothrix aestuarii]|uniref:Uncharacterized protein n=1 Tax=Candidatus Electrothrix aestuarii TaxID=3062594 RepID=A0AAU8M1X6_9BACT|nr:hypothetical protein [Candidatus Electrothrix aestuarii]